MNKVSIAACCACALVVSGCGKGGPEGPAGGFDDGAQVASVPPDSSPVPVPPGPGSVSVIVVPRESAKIDRALAEDAPKLAAGVVVLPAADADGRVRRDGFAISQMAQAAATFIPHRTMAVSPDLCFAFIARGGYATPGRQLDSDAVQDVVGGVGGEISALPQLHEADGSYALSLTLRGSDQPEKTYTHDGPLENLPEVPGLIALDVLDYVRVPLSEGQQQRIRQIQVHAREDLVALNQLFTDRPAVGESYTKFLERNPRCVAAWVRHLLSGVAPAEAVDRLDGLNPPLDSQAIAMARPIAVLSSGRVLEGVDALIALLAEHRSDPVLLSRLVHAAMVGKSDGLVENLLARVPTLDLGYPGALMQIDAMVGWAWEARGSGWASSVTADGWEKFQQRLQAAQEMGAEAVGDNPRDWWARAKLIDVAKGLGQGRAYVDAQFQAAVEANPWALPVYQSKFAYLQPRWQGSPEELIAFGRECYQTGLWNSLIPPLFLAAVQDVAYNPMTFDLDASRFADEQLWNDIKAYHEGSRQSDIEGIRTAAKDFFACTGALGGHFDDVVDVYRQLDLADRPVTEQGPMVDRGTFLGLGRFRYLRDLTLAEAGTADEQAAAAMRLALGAGQFDEAERRLEDAGDDPQPEQARKQLALARRLEAEGSVTLSPEEMLESFVVLRGNWSVEGDWLVCPLDTFDYGALLFPIGLASYRIEAPVESTSYQWGYGLKLHTQSRSTPLEFREINHRARFEVLHGPIVVDAVSLRSGPHVFDLQREPDSATFTLRNSGVVVPDRYPPRGPEGFVVYGIAYGEQTTLRMGPLKISKPAPSTGEAL